MAKRMSALLIVLMALTACSNQASTKSDVEELNKTITNLNTQLESLKEDVALIKADNEKLKQQPTLSYFALDKDHVYYSETIPDKMGPGSIIKFISENEFVVEEGYAMGGYDTDTSLDYPKPLKDMVISYADDGYILKILEP